MGMSVIPMMAPVLGGILDETFGWRANFSLLLIAGAALMTAMVLWKFGFNLSSLLGSAQDEITKSADPKIASRDVLALAGRTATMETAE